MFRWVAVGALLLSVGGCAGPRVETTYQGPTYTCCVAADIDRIYHPGDTLTIHWIVQGSPAPSGAVLRFELNAHLDGPFGSVEELKSQVVHAKGQAAGPQTVAAAPVRPTGAAGEQPVSTIPIPLTAEPGYYNLETSVGAAGSTFSGGSIIQIAAGS
jgi:hypothetical protein